MTAPFGPTQFALSDPYNDRVPITPDDNNDLPDGVCKGIVSSADGTLNVVMGNGTDRTILVFKGFNPSFIKRVKTGESAAALTLEAGY